MISKYERKEGDNRMSFLQVSRKDLLRMENQIKMKQ